MTHSSKSLQILSAKRDEADSDLDPWHWIAFYGPYISGENATKDKEYFTFIDIVFNTKENELKYTCRNEPMRPFLLTATWQSRRKIPFPEDFQQGDCVMVMEKAFKEKEAEKGWVGALLHELVELKIVTEEEAEELGEEIPGPWLE